MSSASPNMFDFLFNELANFEIECILEKNVKRNIEILKSHILLFNEIVDQEVEMENEPGINAYKSITYNLYRLKDRFEAIRDKNSLLQ